jgi:mono/diheme cytochrome c family protein
MRRAALLLIALALVLSASSARGQGAASGAPPGNAENGKKLFVERACWQCHGLAAQGGGIAGPRLAGRVPAWPAFSRYVRRPTEEMIPYPPKTLSDTELADIYAWLRAIPPPPAVSSIPQLNRK